MATLSFNVGQVYCYDCVKALENFIGKMKGVHSVAVENDDSAVIEYDPAGLEIEEERFEQIVRDNIERLGFIIKKY